MNNKNKNIIIELVCGIIIILIIIAIYITFLNKSKTNLDWSIDKGNNDMCIQVVETIYEDAKYRYTVPNPCIANYKVVYSNGESYTLKEALSKGKVTIDELMDKDIKIYKEKK